MPPLVPLHLLPSPASLSSSSLRLGVSALSSSHRRFLAPTAPGTASASRGLAAMSWLGKLGLGGTGHNEVVRVQYDPAACKYDDLLDTFWTKHDPTTPNRQGNDVGSQYRSGIYYYTPEQEKTARESLERQQKVLNRKIVTEILPAKKFYRAEEYHQQYLEKGGRFGFKQSADKGCNDPIRCYG